MLVLVTRAREGTGPGWKGNVSVLWFPSPGKLLKTQGPRNHILMEVIPVVAGVVGK